jgi:hypothetical protein
LNRPCGRLVIALALRLGNVTALDPGSVSGNVTRYWAGNREATAEREDACGHDQRLQRKDWTCGRLQPPRSPRAIPGASSLVLALSPC